MSDQGGMAFDEAREDWTRLLVRLALEAVRGSTQDTLETALRERMAQAAQVIVLEIDRGDQ